MCVLRQSTQVVVRVGSFMDASDGVTPETGITLAAADQAELLKAAGAATVDISGNTWAAITGAGGWYDLTLTTTDTNTVGDITVVIQDASVCLPVFTRFTVVEEAVYDQLYASTAPGAATPAAVAAVQADTDNLQTRLPTTLVGGRIDASVGGADAGGVTSLENAIWNAVRASHVAVGTFGQGVANVIGTVTTVTGNVNGSVGSVAANGITAASIATDAIDSDAIAGSAVTEIQSGLATGASIATAQADLDDIQTRLPATLSGGRMRSQVEGMDAGVITAAVIATGAVDADALAADAGTEIAAAVDVTLSAAHGAGAWGGGGGLTAQQVRDSMMLAPTAGAPAAGSVDEHLDDILADTAAMQPLVDVATSTRATNAGVDAAVTASHGVGSYVDSGAAPTVAAIDAQLSGTHGAGAWGGGGGLSAQDVRDALKLAPSAGAPAAGSIDDELDEIMGPGFDPATDSLEEIKEKLEECCGVEVSGVNIEGI